MNKSRVGFCASYFNDFNNQRRQISSGIDASLVLTLVGLSFSFVCLLSLMVTYSIFSKLRSLPGKNLTSFSTSLLVYLLCLMSLHINNPTQPSCKAFAIRQHYLSLAMFTNMAVIAYHSRKTFARKLPEKQKCDQDELKAFMKYCLIGWGLPAIFLAICVSVDELKVVKHGYSEDVNCWIDSTVLPYFFVLPIGCVPLISSIMFSITIYHIRQQQRATNLVLKKSKLKMNLQFISIFLKLSTAMGSEWLFGVLVFFFPHINAFSYIFVILFSLEGVYIAVAFVFTRKIYRMYREIQYGKGEKMPRRKLEESTLIPLNRETLLMFRILKC